MRRWIRITRQILAEKKILYGRQRETKRRSVVGIGAVLYFQLSSFPQLHNSPCSLMSSTMCEFMQAVSSFLARTFQVQTSLKTHQKRQLEYWRALCMRRWLYHEANVREVCLFCCRPICSVHAHAPRLDPSTLFKVLVWTAWRLLRTSFNCQLNLAFSTVIITYIFCKM